MSAPLTEVGRSVHPPTSNSEEPPQSVVYGPPQHDTDVPEDPEREVLVTEETLPCERDLYACFEHFRVGVSECEDEDDEPSLPEYRPITRSQIV